MSSGVGNNYQFKMFMEGIQVPFISANIMCTPQGVEASINLQPDDLLYNLKPKTNIQIFFKEWAGDDAGWRIMFDGYFSRFDKNDSTQGKGVAILCRDFRMDIRRTPAAMAYMSSDELSTSNLYNATGIKKHWILKRTSSKGKEITKVNNIPTYGGDLNTAGYLIDIIAGVAIEGKYKNQFSSAVSRGEVYGGSFLDSFIKGVWMSSVGGTTYAPFINSRIRADKRIITPSNRSGYSFLNREHLNKFGASAIMGNGRFTSVESAIMRLAGICQSSSYSCNTPSLIYLGKNQDDVNKYVIDQKVHDFIVNDKAQNFGPPFALNETMLLPPLTFTAPPTCNILFPSMYERCNWQHDYDVDYTRGYYSEIPVFGSKTELDNKSYEVPNSLFSKQGSNPPLTMDERYKGVNVLYGSLKYYTGYSISSKEKELESMSSDGISESDKMKMKEKKEAKDNEEINNIAEDKDDNLISKERLKAIARVKKKKLKEAIEKSKSSSNKSTVNTVLNRHAVFKFLHGKYKGRSVVIDSQFNPYVISGFPGVIIAGKNKDGSQFAKTLIGKIQQVKHIINSKGLAKTSLIFSHVRFIDKPTDIDDMGTSLFIPETKPINAEIDPETKKYLDPLYRIPYGRPDVKYKYTARKKDSLYDWDYLNPKKNEDHIFAKDVLLISEKGKQEGKTNRGFIDDIYAPNSIGRFYEKVFGQKNDFMIGSRVLKDPHTGKERLYEFIYDSIHEAIYNLEQNESLVNNYNQSVKYIRRNICSEEGFYFGILGASYKDGSIYLTKDGISGRENEFNHLITRDEYYGIDDKTLEKLNGFPRAGLPTEEEVSQQEKVLQEAKEGRIISNDEKPEFSINLKSEVKEAKAKLKNIQQRRSLYKYQINESTDMCSSIMERTPVTSFIKERRDVVRQYRERLSKNARRI